MAPTLKCKEPASRPPWAHSGAGIGLGKGGCPRQVGGGWSSPQSGGALGVILPDVCSRRRETPKWDRAGRSWLPSAHAPCRPGRGLPRLCAPLASQVHALKLAIWFLPLAPLGREQAHAIDIAVLPVEFQ